MKTLFNFIPRLAWSLAGYNVFRFILLATLLYYFAFTRRLLPNFRKKDFRLVGWYNKKPLTFWLRNPMDIAVLVEVFVFKEYEWKLETEPKVIVDLGAHFGDTALYYNAVYPEAKIIAVEPSTENYERLEQHVGHIENILTVNAAVGTEDTTVQLHVGKSSLGHSIVKRSQEDITFEVPQYTLQTLCRMCDVTSLDLLKFDIEGAEFPLLESIDVHTAAKSYIGEMHFDLNQKYSEDTFDVLVPNVNIKKEHIFGERFMIKFSV